MTKTLFAGINVGRGEATGVATGDYHAVDPAVFNVNTAGAVALAIDVNMQQQTGSGNTVTVTVSGVSDEGSGTLYTIATKTITAVGVQRIEIDPRVPFSNTPIDASVLSIQEDLPGLVQVACVGSGTRTTLVYDVTAVLTK